MRTKYLLYTGNIIPIVFWITTLICGWMMGDYNHFTRMVSELGAIGTPSQFVFTIGLLLCSALSVAFVIGLFKTCRVIGISTLPAIVILSYSISIAGAAIFPLPLRLHLYLGMPSILLITSPLLSFFLWNRSEQPSDLRSMSVLCFVIMSLGFLAYFPELLSQYPGIKQRFFHAGWSIWFFYLSYTFTNRNT